MAIKHQGNKAANGWKVPTAASMEEREIAIDLAEPAFYTKDELGNVLKISERGGLLWDSRQAYSTGDVVTNSLPPHGAFIALADNKGVTLPPNGDINASWQSITTEYYNALTGGASGGGGVPATYPSSTGGAQHWPAGTQRYPDTSGERIGARWMIKGLGLDVNDDPITYLIVGGGLSNVAVADGDTITWIDGVTSGTPGDGAEIWLWSPEPRVNGERSGMLFRTDEDYLIGDVVTDSVTGDVYTATFGTLGIPNKDNEPSASPSEWKKTTGYEVYDSSKTYVPGDIVSIPGGNDYIVPPGASTPTVSPPQIPWVKATTKPERGGVAWYPAHFYVIGDMVVDTIDGNLYKAVGNSSGSQPSTSPASWKRTGGSTTYDSGTVYNPGDIVTVGDDIYIAPPGGVPAGVTPPAAPWLKSTRGGQLWEGNIHYLLGDVATWEEVAYVAISNSVGQQPRITNGYWQKAGGSTTYSSGTWYNPGDLVTIDDDIYIVSSATPTNTAPPGASWTRAGINRYVDAAGDSMSGNLDMGTNVVIIDNHPTSGVHSSNKSYVDQQDTDIKNTYVKRTGSSMSGDLNMGGNQLSNVGNPDSGDDAVSRNYADARYVNVAGDSMTGDLIMGGNQVRNIGAPLDEDDAIRRDTYAKTTQGGTLKARLVNVSGDWTLYLTNDGSNP